MFSKLGDVYQIMWYLIAGFKTIVLCSIDNLYIMIREIYVLQKIWLLKTLTRIVKYESRVVGRTVQYLPMTVSELPSSKSKIEHFILFYTYVLRFLIVFSLFLLKIKLIEIFFIIFFI